MNEMKVLTVRDVFFEDNNGKQVSGQQLWLIAPTAEEGWNGWEVLKLWIADGSPLEAVVSNLKHDDTVMVEFNRRGKAQQIVPA